MCSSSFLTPRRDLTRTIHKNDDVKGVFCFVTHTRKREHTLRSHSPLSFLFFHHLSRLHYDIHNTMTTTTTTTNTTTTYRKISVSPGQPIVRHPRPVGFGDDGVAAWNDFCDAYDALVVTPYRRAKLLIVTAFLSLLVTLMGIMTLSSQDDTNDDAAEEDDERSLPTGTAFLIAPCLFLIVAGGAVGYMFVIYPRVSHALEDLCRRQRHPNLVVRYVHNDARHDLSEHVIEIASSSSDAETAVSPEATTTAAADATSSSSSGLWSPLLPSSSSSLPWGRRQNNSGTHHR